MGIPSGAQNVIVGCYVLDLYCDTPTCKRHRGQGAQYTGSNERKAWQSARSDGWYRHKSSQGWLVFCDQCPTLK